MGILDIIAANGLFFAYSGDKVLVFNSGGDTIKILEFPDNKKYGKFNPVYHNPRLHMPGVNVMAIFQNPSAYDRQDVSVGH